MLLNLAQSPHERECVRVATFGILAHKKYGFERMEEHTAVIEESIMEAQKIREEVEDLAQTDKSLMEAYGIVDPVDSSDSCCEESEEKEPLQDKTTPLSANPLSTLCTLLV